MANALVFRAAFRPVFFALCAVPLPIVVLCCYIGFGRRITAVVHQAIALGLGPKIGLLGVLFSALLLAVVAFAALALSQRLLVHLRETGVAARTAWGRAAFIGWEDIEQVRRVNLPFASFLRVTGAGRTIFLPLFVTDQPGLRKGVALLAPKDHPIREALRGAESSS